jgi:hypothetical protein
MAILGKLTYLFFDKIPIVNGCTIYNFAQNNNEYEKRNY